MTALHLASQNGHLDIIQWLIKAGSVAYRVDNDRNMNVHLAAESGHEEIVATLLDAIPDHVERCLEKWDQHLPEWSSKEGGADAAFREVLVAVGGLVKGPRRLEVAPEGWTMQNRQTLKSKVILGLQIWDKERHSIPSTALMRAVLGRHANVVKLILRKVPEVPLQAQHYSYANVLSLAASKGNTEIAGLLITVGSDVNAITDTQETCLHEAAENGRAQVIELLLQKGANPDLARLRDGSTPLHLAAERGHADAVKALVRLAFVNVSDDLGRTALHRACQEGHEAVVDLLLDANADVLAQDFEQKTPLAVASELSEKTRVAYARTGHQTEVEADCRALTLKDGLVCVWLPSIGRSKWLLEHE
jgi:ankyrin repeat protein